MDGKQICARERREMEKKRLPGKKRLPEKATIYDSLGVVVETTTTMKKKMTTTRRRLTMHAVTWATQLAMKRGLKESAPGREVSRGTMLKEEEKTKLTMMLSHRGCYCSCRFLLQFLRRCCDYFRGC